MNAPGAFLRIRDPAIAELLLLRIHLAYRIRIVRGNACPVIILACGYVGFHFVWL